MRKKIVETCEMCSAEVKNPTTIKVEGALLRVCPRCVSFGNIVEKPGTKPAAALQRGSSRSTQRSTTKSRSSSTNKSKDEDEKVLIDNYGKEIKKARMKKKLTQEQLSQLTGVSVAYIRSIETEKIRPTERVATKLQRELGIELFEEVEAQLQFQEKSKQKGTTVGDIVTIKRLEFD
jgi:uncharacterized protein (TIGR00270 family)